MPKIDAPQLKTQVKTSIFQLIRSAVAAVQPEEVFSLYLAQGQENRHGQIIAKYLPERKVTGHSQALESNFEQSGKIAQNQCRKKIWLNLCAENKVQGLLRQEARGGDFIRFQDGSYWLVTSISEDYGAVSNWLALHCTLQTVPPDFSASDWYKEEEKL